jgi:hypothetical protein
MFSSFLQAFPLRGLGRRCVVDVGGWTNGQAEEDCTMIHISWVRPILKLLSCRKQSGCALAKMNEDTDIAIFKGLSFSQHKEQLCWAKIMVS